MNVDEFFDLVKRMRQAQKNYFNGGRLPKDLIQSKELERHVDEAIKRGLTITVKPTATQENLFKEGAQ